MQEFLNKISSISEVKEKNYKDSYIENKIKAFVYDYFAQEEANQRSYGSRAFVYDVEDINFDIKDRDIYTIKATLCVMELDLKSKKSYLAVIKIKEEGDWWTIQDIEIDPQFGELGSSEDLIEDMDSNILKLRSIAAIYYSFCLFEAPKKNVAAIVNCYAKEFEVMYPWGGCKTYEQLVKWVSGISEKSSYAHHVRNLKISNIQNAKVECFADVTYQTINDNGEFRNMELKYNFILQDNENGFPQIFKSITTLNKD
jgi:hypothetical protein